MGNSNTISIPHRVLPSRELNQGGTSSSISTFVDSSANAVYLRIPSNSELSNRMFKVRAHGRVTGGTTTNFTVTLTYGLAGAATTAIKASTARAVDSANHNWFIEAVFNWDTTSNKLQGVSHAMVANLYDVWAANTNVPTAVDSTTNTEPSLIVRGTFSTGNAGNLAYLDGFSLEEL